MELVYVLFALGVIHAMSQLAKHVPRLGIGMGAAVLLAPVIAWWQVIAGGPFARADSSGLSGLINVAFYAFLVVASVFCLGFGCFLVGIGVRALRGDDPDAGEFASRLAESLRPLNRRRDRRIAFWVAMAVVIGGISYLRSRT